MPTERSFYEIKRNWERLTLTPLLQEKVRTIADLIPPNAHSLLDVGCGNGVITNGLTQPDRIVGLDWSLTALAQVAVPHICASSEALPIRAGCFDMILSSELLEHLDEATFHGTLREIERLAPRYLLLSVPNTENIHINEVRCRVCGAVFNASHHRRSFTAASLAALFPTYRTTRSQVGGQPVRAYPLPLLRLRQKLGRRWFQVPAGRIVMCPACGNRDFPRTRHNPASLLFDGLNKLISRRHPYWLYLLMERG